MEQTNQQTQDNQQVSQEEPQYKWIITDFQAQYLQGVRAALVNERAYEILNMSQETMFVAAQANGYSRGRLALIDEILETAQIVRSD